MPDAGTELILTGYAYSVYTRSVRIALAEKGLNYTYIECDPFDPADQLLLLREHPFGRVPVLKDRGFRVFETAAVLDYIEVGFDGPTLMPADACAVARVRQVIAVIDHYAYWPLVRQAFSHGVFQPLMGEEAEASTLQAGLAAAPRVLDALEEIAGEGLVLCSGQMCLASCHLWPMLDYFAMLPEGREMLIQRDALSAWMYWMGQRASVLDTKPQLPMAGGHP